MPTDSPTPRGHLIDGEFQSDKYPTCPLGKVPLSVKDKTAQDLLWAYAQRRRAVDAGFSADLETALRTAGFAPAASRVEVEVREEDRVEALMFLGMVGAKITDYNKGCAARVIANTRQNALASARQAYEVEREAYATELMLDLNRIASDNYRALYSRHQPFFDALQAAEAERQKLVEEQTRILEKADVLLAAERAKHKAVLITERSAREAAERERKVNAAFYRDVRGILKMPGWEPGLDGVRRVVAERDAALARVGELEAENARLLSLVVHQYDGCDTSRPNMCQWRLQIGKPPFNPYCDLPANHPIHATREALSPSEPKP